MFNKKEGRRKAGGRKLQEKRNKIRIYGSKKRF